MRTAINFIVLGLLLHSTQAFSQPYWNTLSGEDIGNIYGIATYHNCIYVGTDRGKILSSTNNGKSWRSWYIDKPCTIVSMATTSSGKVLAGTEDGVYRSLDSGIHWTRLVPAMSGDTDWFLSVNGMYTVPPSTVIAFDAFDVHLSTDDGTTWVHSSRVTTDEGMDAVVYDPKIIYAGDFYSGLYSSTDSAKTWSKLDLLGNKVSLLSRDSGANIYAGTVGFILRTSDQGTHWDTVWKKSGVTPQILACSRTGQLAFSTVDDDVYISQDTGKTWRAIHTSRSGGYYRDLSFADSLIIIGASKGVFALDPLGGQMRDLFIGLAEQTITAAAGCSRGYIAATNDGRLFTTHRDTVRWRDVTDTSIFSQVTSAVSLDSTILISTDRGVLNFHPSTGLFEHPDSVIGPYPVRNIFRAENNEIYVEGTGGHGDLFRSMNSGKNWIECDSGIPGGGVLGLVATQKHGLIASTDYWFYQSTDDGKSWIPLRDYFAPKGVLDLKVLSNDTIVGASPLAGLVKSGPPYMSWSTVNGGGSRPTALWKSKTGVLYSLSDSADGQYISKDTGNTWTLVPPFLIGRRIHSIISDESGGALASTDGGGVYSYSDTAVGWQPASSGFVARNVNSLTATSTTVYAASDSGVYSTLDSGETWTRLSSSDSGFVTNSIFATDDGLVLAGMSTNRIIRSTDGGKSWSHVTPFSDPYSGIWSFFAGEKGIYLCSQAGVFASYDTGRTWDSIHVYSYMAGVQTKDGTIYIASTDGAVKQSTDFGRTWSNADDGTRDGWIPCLILDSSGVVYAGEASGLYTYDTNSRTWHQLNSWSPSAAYTAPSGIKIIGMHYGDIVYSTEPDSLWPIVNTTWPGTSVQSITSLGDWVFVASQNYGVIRSKLPGLIKSAGISKSSAASGLPQLTLYPNPAADRCTVHFLSGNAEPVTCELYSVDGRRLRSWRVQANGLGTNQNTFSTADLINGVYFLHASNPGWSATAKFVKMR